MVSLCSALRQVKHDPFAVLAPQHVAEVCSELDHHWRETQLTPVVTVQLFIQQVAMGNISIDEVLSRAKLDVTPSAYCQARSRLPLSLLERLTGEALQVMESAGQDEWLGHRCFFVDGSSFSMPDTLELQKEFGQPKGQRKGCGFPVGHVLAMFNAKTGALSRPALSPLYTSDLEPLPLMHEQMREADVICGDVTFASWGHFALLLQRNLHAVMPNHQNRIVSFTPGRSHAMPGRTGGKELPRSRWIKSLGEKDQLVEWFKPTTCPWWMSQERYDALPESIIVREVQRTIYRKGYRSITVTVVTTLLDPLLYPADELIALRMRRWEAETNFRHLKTTMKMDVLRCKTVAGVKKEVCVFVLVYNLVRAVMGEAAKRQNLNINRISFASALHWLRHASPGEELKELQVVPWRPDRVEPRVKKRRPKQFSLMCQPRKKLREKLRNPRKTREMVLA